MTTQEIREMLDSTINSNNTRGISGQSLNAALNAILDLVSEKGTESVAGTLIILLPNDEVADNLDAEFLAHNKAVFDALAAQTNSPLSVFMRYKGGNILSNPAMRIRSNEDGSYDYAHIGFNGVDLFAERCYRLYGDGTVKEIDINGDLKGGYAPKFKVYINKHVEGSVDGKVFYDGSIEVALDTAYDGSEKAQYARLAITYPGLSENYWIKESRPYTLDESTGMLTIQGVLQGKQGEFTSERKDVEIQIAKGGKEMHLIQSYVFAMSNPNAYVFGTSYSMLNGQ